MLTDFMVKSDGNYSGQPPERSAAPFDFAAARLRSGRALSEAEGVRGAQSKEAGGAE
jgi:hypothetical protein